MDERIKQLDMLSKAKNNLIKYNRNYRLQQKGIYDNSEEIFKPIINEQIKNTNLLKELTESNHLKSIEYNKANLPIQLKTNKIGTERLSKSWRFYQNDKGEYFLNDKLLVIEDDNIRLANSNNSYPFTDNLKALLNGINIDNIDDENDLINYSNLITEAKSSKSSQRYDKLMKNLHHHGNGIITISENPNELWSRLEILLAANKEGHNNNLEERTAILDKLLKLKEITIDQYKRFL